MLLTATISNTILNISLLALPQPMLPKLQLPLRQKLATGGIFALGTLYAYPLLSTQAANTPTPQRLRHQHNPPSPLHPRQLKLLPRIHQPQPNLYLDLPRISPRPHNRQSPHPPPPLPLPLQNHRPTPTPEQTTYPPPHLPRQRSLTPNETQRRRNPIDDCRRNAARESKSGFQFRDGRRGNEGGNRSRENHGGEAYELSQ